MARPVVVWAENTSKEQPLAKRTLSFQNGKPEDENSEQSSSKRLKVELPPVEPPAKKSYLSSRPVLGEDSFGCQLPSGERYFIKFQDPYTNPVSEAGPASRPIASDTSYIDRLFQDLDELRKMDEQVRVFYAGSCLDMQLFFRYRSGGRNQIRCPAHYIFSLKRALGG